MQFISILLLLFTFLKTTLSLSSYDATQLCNENILANIFPSQIGPILGQTAVPTYQGGQQLEIPLTSQENAFWKLQTDETIGFDFESIFGEQFWITGVAINEIPTFNTAFQFDCNLTTNEFDTQLYEIRTVGDDGVYDLESFYTEGEDYSFKPVAEGVNVSVKIAVNPVVSSGIEITKLSDGNNNNNNLPRCVRIDIYGCQVAEMPLYFPKILFYNSPVPDNGISDHTSYTGICSGTSCTGGNGVLNDGIYGPFSTINDTIGFTNCLGCKITFFFSRLVSIDTIIIEGMYEGTSGSYPPHRVKILSEGVDKITYDPPNFISDCFYTPDEYYCIVIGTEINSASSVTIQLDSYQDSSILLNEIEFYSNGFLLNFETEQINDEGDILATTTTTNMQTPPPPPPPNPNTPPNENIETPTTAGPMGGGQPPLPPQMTDEIFDLSSPATIISIFLCLICTATSSVGIFLVTFCWFFLVKYRLSYEVVKKELDRRNTTQDVLAKTSALHSNHCPELVFEQFTDNTVVRPQVALSMNQLQAKPPLPNNHPPSNSYVSQERIYEAIPAQQRRHSKSSSVYEVEELNDYTQESYTAMSGHTVDTNPFSKTSMSNSQGGDSSRLIPMREAVAKEEGYMAMSAAV